MIPNEKLWFSHVNNMNFSLKTRFYAMLLSWGVDHLDKEDLDYLYIKGSTQKADGEFKSYFPKFMGFGKTDKISSIGVFKEGELLSYKEFNKYGDVINYWDK